MFSIYRIERKRKKAKVIPLEKKREKTKVISLDDFLHIPQEEAEDIPQEGNLSLPPRCSVGRRSLAATIKRHASGGARASASESE